MISYAFCYVTSVSIPENEEEALTIGLSKTLTKGLSEIDAALYERVMKRLIEVVGKNTSKFCDNWTNERVVTVTS
jgi:hypothetical protein